MNFVEAIARKRDGLSLDAQQISHFVAGASGGEISPEQLAAMLMAICCRGMTDEETHLLTDAMLHSGERWALADTIPNVVDKHSTGGVGDTVSLVLAPWLAAVGVPVAMMAGRGLGHSQGTLDKLEAMPGFRVDWNRRETLDLIDQCGVAMVAQTDDVAPADRTLYALRDVTGTVPSLPLIVSSIMSKKLALGASALILDVKWGRGAFRKTVAEAHELAAALRSVGRAAGCATEALITDMNQPLAPTLGTACEVRAAREVLSGQGDPRLRELSRRLCKEALILHGSDPENADRDLDQAMTDGSALAKWDELVRCHGGDPDPDRLAEPRDRIEVQAAHSGWVGGIDAEALGWIAVDVGAGRRQQSEAIAHGSGVDVLVRIGDRVEAGQPVARILVGERTVDGKRQAERVAAAFEISEQICNEPDLVIGSVDEVQELL